MSSPPPTTSAEPLSVERLQRRTVGLLTVGQVLGGLGLGSTLSIGALLAEHVSGDAAWSGMAATMSTLGAAAAAVPLARLASRRGRRIALSLGSMVASAGAVLAIIAAATPSFVLLLIALALLGCGSAVNLQARFAATDLASARHRGRDLSLVVWSTTIGAVLGPNLVGPGEVAGAALGLPLLTGPFLFTIAAQLAAATVYALGLRPDPLKMRQQLAAAPSATPAAGADRTDAPRLRLAIATVALSHATMVGVMSMTPVHLSMNGASITIVGLVISLHIAGMYGFSPVFGILADRVGRIQTILLSQLLLAAALITTALGAGSQSGVTVGLILLGLGWSGATVAGSALLTESVASARRTTMQGRSDLIMNLAGATGGALAGPVLTGLGYSGLSVVAGGLVAVVLISVAAVTLGRRAPREGAALVEPGDL
ncbi:MAG: MFS transporter [Lacisediminihabitans sp.]